MKLLKKLFVITLAIGMVMGMGAVSAYADTTESSSEDSTVREVVFYEDFEGEDMVVGSAPEKVGGVSQTWGYVTASDGNNYYGASIVSDSDNGTKALQLGNNGMAAATPMDEYISFGDTYNSGKYEFSYKVRSTECHAYSSHFMTLANASRERATWECITYGGWFWISHNGVISGAPANAVGNGFGTFGLSSGVYSTVKVTVDFDKKTYQTHIINNSNSTTHGGMTYSLNKDSVSGLKSDFTFRFSDGDPSNGVLSTYYIDEIKVTKIYDLIGDLPIKDGAVFKGSYTLSELNLSEEGVEYKYAYTKNGRTIYPFESGNTTAELEIGDYTLKVTAQKTGKDGNKVTATKEVSFKVVKDYEYTDDEYEIVFSEDFEDMTAGSTPATIGGASQSLSSLSKIVYDEDNKTYALDMTKETGGEARNEYINFGKTYNSGFYTFGYKYRPKNDSAWASYFMRLTNSGGSAGTSEALIGTNFYFSHTASASNLNSVIGGPSTADNGKYVDVSTKVDFSQNKYKVTVVRPGDENKYITDYLNLSVDNVGKFMTRFEGTNYHSGAGSNLNATGEYYIDDIYVKEHYCLAVGLPFKTGEKYAAGIKLPEITLDEDVEHYEVYTKDGETVELETGDALTAGEYTLKVVAQADGYDKEERIVKFTVVSDGLTVSNSSLIVDDEVKDSFTNGDNVKAKIKISTALGFGDFNVIAVMRDSSDDSVENIFVKSKSDLDENGVATFDFTIPDTGDYKLEYFIWENVNSLKAITPKGEFGKSSAAD